MRKINENVIIVDEARKVNSKASEQYISVSFIYSDENDEWSGWIPVEYRRTGVNIPSDDDKNLDQYLLSLYESLRPSHYPNWKKAQDAFWANSRSVETKEIFNILSDGKWHCRNCEISNPNFARRIQDLKEQGYTIATEINYHCPVCKNNRSTRLLLVPINRIELAGNGYENWSETLRKRIISVLGGIDVYELSSTGHCLPDHKFSEIRWDDLTKAENPDNMTDEEIKAKFQLLTNQRNQQKREVCRACTQTGKRGYPFGIKYYYVGDENWDTSIPTKGKDAEKGCIGCGWYDIAEWRKHLTEELSKK